MVQVAQNLTFLTQTRVHTGDLPHQRGNCFPAAIACLMGLSNPEAVFQVQEHYDRDQPGDDNNWVYQLENWLNQRGLTWQQHDGHLMNNQPYMVVGTSPRGNSHVCIYRNGKLLHDTHPDGGGLLTEDRFETIEPLSVGSQLNQLRN